MAKRKLTRRSQRNVRGGAARQLTVASSSQRSGFNPFSSEEQFDAIKLRPLMSKGVSSSGAMVTIVIKTNNA